MLAELEIADADVTRVQDAVGSLRDTGGYHQGGSGAGLNSASGGLTMLKNDFGTKTRQ